MMKPIALVFFLAATALAQVPDKSASGSTTIWVRDTIIPLPYGPDETRAVVSACNTTETRVMYMQFIVFYKGAEVVNGIQADAVKTSANGWCATILALGPKAQIAQVDIMLTSTAGTPIGGNTAAQSNSRRDLPAMK